jgi:hypothetical protein
MSRTHYSTLPYSFDTLTGDDDVVAPSAHSLGASYQAAIVPSSGGIYEGEECLIYGSEVDRVESRLLPRNTTTDLIGPQLAAPDPGMRQVPLRR